MNQVSEFLILILVCSL